MHLQHIVHVLEKKEKFCSEGMGEESCFVPSIALSPLDVLGEPGLDSSLSKAFPAGKLQFVKQRSPISLWGNSVSGRMELAT